MRECEKGYTYLLLNSIKDIHAAERIIKKAGLNYKLVPVPTELSPDCGICIRFCKKDRDRLESFLAGKIDGFTIRSIGDRDPY